MFGPHLILDGSQCDTQKLGDRILIEQILTDYPAAIGMTRIGGPYMFEYQAPDPAYSGVSGIVVIAESHIAIHTFPALDYFSMDIFSCKNFDHERAIKYIEDALDVKHMDRMLVQRGLSFRGPHHGANGATDELIAAAEARLAAGIVSNETVTPEEAAVARAHQIARHGAAHSGPATSGAGSATTGDGHMVWPRYGATPDIGTYGAQAQGAGAAVPADCEPCARDGARVVALDGSAGAPRDAAGQPLPPTTPVQVNPTASISGLLDKLGGIGAGGRALSRAASAWEHLARDPHSAVGLALSVPVVADGLRETLVYAIEQRYVDVVVLCTADLIADLHEALGHFHYLAGDQPRVGAADAARTSAFLAEFAAAFVAQSNSAPVGATSSGRAVLRALGESLATRAPRKGVLQAASASGVPVYCPDLMVGALGQALVAAGVAGTLGAKGATATVVRVDPLLDVVDLAQHLGTRPHVGLIAAGTGPADALVSQALTLPAAATTALTDRVYVERGANAVSGVYGASEASTIAVATEATLALPLLITSLAQRLPDSYAARRAAAHAAQSRQTTPQEPALA